MARPRLPARGDYEKIPILNGPVFGEQVNAGGASSRIDHWKLFEERFLILAQKNSRIGDKTIVHLNMLPGAHWLERTHCEGTTRLWNVLFPGGDQQPNIVHRGRHLDHLQHMVSAGLGVCFGLNTHRISTQSSPVRLREINYDATSNCALSKGADMHLPWMHW
jgi:DNA-binding transcriptional LysR family regulator